MRNGAAIRRILISLAVLGVLFACADLVLAQEPPPSPVPTGPNVPKAGLDLIPNRTILLTISLILFGLIIIFLEFLLLKKRTADKIDDLAKFFIITLIIIGTLVLVGAGFSGEQIAPVIGLFGTVAGYLLGRNSHGQAGPDEAPSDASRPLSTPTTTRTTPTTTVTTPTTTTTTTPATPESNSNVETSSSDTSTTRN